MCQKEERLCIEQLSESIIAVANRWIMPKQEDTVRLGRNPFSGGRRLGIVDAGVDDD